MTDRFPTYDLGEVGELYDSLHQTPQYAEEGYPMIRVTDIRRGFVETKGAVRVDEETYLQFSKKHKPQLGDILFSRVGSYGNSAYVNRREEFCLGQNTVCISPEKSRIEPYFLYCSLNSDDLRHQIESLVGGASQGTISLKSIRKLQVPTPPLPVQRRIAGILSAYDELIENNQRRIRILEDMARTLYREWFVDFRFPGHGKVARVASTLGKIPRAWGIVTFTAIADVLSGGTPKTDVAEYWNGEIPFFTPRDAPDCFYVQDTDKHVTELGLSKCASELYPPDTIFITARGTVGKVALPSVPMAMNQSCYALRGKPGIPQRFLFLMTLEQVAYLKTNTGGATFATIVVDTFNRMNVVKPDGRTIERFARATDAMFEQINTLQRQIAVLRKTRDLLMLRLLSVGVPSGRKSNGDGE
jgi:type I restriction enzyme, S subunit